MKIILSPSKTQEIEKLNPLLGRLNVHEDGVRLRLHRQLEETKKIVEEVQKIDRETLGKKMKISGDLLDKTYQQYQVMEEQPRGNAILSYKGTVFKALNLGGYTEKMLRYLGDHVVILSALYGPIPALYKIHPYRLDMKSGIFAPSLYQRWQPFVDEWFDHEDMVIDLASGEFSKMVKRDCITIEFLQRTGDQEKTIAYHSKLGRGLMLDYMINRQVDKLDDLKEFKAEGYEYDHDKSTKNHLVFVRDHVNK